MHWLIILLLHFFYLTSFRNDSRWVDCWLLKQLWGLVGKRWKCETKSPWKNIKVISWFKNKIKKIKNPSEGIRLSIQKLNSIEKNSIYYKPTLKCAHCLKLFNCGMFQKGVFFCNPNFPNLASNSILTYIYKKQWSITINICYCTVSNWVNVKPDYQILLHLCFYITSQLFWNLGCTWC